MLRLKLFPFEHVSRTCDHFKSGRKSNFPSIFYHFKVDRENTVCVCFKDQYILNFLSISRNQNKKLS